MGLSLFYKSISSRSIVGIGAVSSLKGSLEDLPRPKATSTSLASGYRELSKNKTLAGREAARHFNGEDRDVKPNRLRMVSSLRQKERSLIWRHVINDLCRYVVLELNRLNPVRVLVPDTYYNSAVRFRR